MPLNDPHWGRGPAEDSKEQGREPQAQDDGAKPQQNQADQQPASEQPQDKRNDPRASDLDELWNEFNKTLQGILTGGKGAQESPRPQERPAQDFSEQERGEQQGGDDGSLPPSAGGGHRGYQMPVGGSPVKGIIGAAVLGLIAWMASGFYIVPEGQIGVVTTFGKYTKDASAGFSWRMPWPIQDAEIVDISSVRKAEIGIYGGAQRLKEALMLTDDENIVDVQFNVQYRIKPGFAKDYLFRTRAPDESVRQAAESAMREVVGRKAMDSVLFESKQEIAQDVRRIMQDMLDRYHTGIDVMSVAIQNAQPPEQVQAAFNDAVKAGQDRERQINEGQAYQNAVVPIAKGKASRLKPEAEGYKARVVETAKGDAERFSRVLAQYQQAPRVTRDRMYIDAMGDILSRTRKIFVDSGNGSNLLYLPLDKLVEGTAADAAAQVREAAAETGAASSVAATQKAARVRAESIDPRQMLRNRTR